MEEINLKELLNYYLKKLPIIIITTLLVLLLGFIYINKIQTPLYHGTTTIILVQKSDDNQSANTTQNELNVNEKLVTTYSQIIKSRRVLEQVITTLNLKQVLYILNEKNFNKGIVEFRNGFLNLKDDDLNIEGEFECFNDIKNSYYYKNVNDFSISTEEFHHSIDRKSVV